MLTDNFVLPLHLLNMSIITLEILSSEMNYIHTHVIGDE